MAELNVSRKNIRQMLTDTLKDGIKKTFVIPEYQRPYSWDKEKCDVLWNDVKDFYNMKDAIKAIDVGLLKYGNIESLSDEVEQMISKITL